jgi:hypothetical protein
VELYALRRSRDGRNDRGQIRSYRLERIRGASIQPEFRPISRPRSFKPRYRIEF